ncbi:MAG: HDOD domain-containing protein [Desulfomonilia bacterium]
MTTIVPTGGMIIGRHGLLKAFLSSCVGIAVHDPNTGMGGMLHVLLPEPVNKIPDYHLTYYASTGIPVFIDELIRRGADVKGMQAFLAGGALVDSFSSHDMDLNIVHRTLEISLSCLKQYGIAIRMVEAGGINPFCLTFEPGTGDYRIEPILLAQRENPHPPGPVEEDALLEIIGRLLPVPQNALTIGNMLSDEDVDVNTVAQEIKKDQVLTAKVLRMCNSSYMGLSRKIASIDHAVVHLGSKLLLQIAMTAQIENIYHFAEGGYSLCRGGMFYHALATARLCKALAAVQKRIDPDVAYTAGLLHDIGKVVLDQYIAGVQPLFYRMLIEKKMDSCRAEREIMGIDHCTAGLMLARSWELPGELTSVIRSHHAPELPEDFPGLVNLVYVSDVLTNRLLPGLELEKVDTSNLKASLDMLGITPAGIYRSIGVVADLY